jgi:MFS family permease
MRRVVGHRDFRLLWLSQAGSTIGDTLVFVVLVLYVDNIGTPSDVGVVVAAQLTPFVALLAVGGVWADRLPRQRVMLVTDLVRGGLHALLAVLIVTGGAEVWQIAAIEVLFGAARAFFRPAYSGLIPQTVPEHLLQQANAVTAMTFNVGQFAGPALGTALFVTVGAGTAFAVDAATFLVSAALLSLVHPRPRGATVARRALLAELREGWDEVRSRTWVWLTIATLAVCLLLAQAPYVTLGPAIAQAAYGDRAVYGVVSALFGAGSIVGSLLALRWRGRLNRQHQSPTQAFADNPAPPHEHGNAIDPGDDQVCRHQRRGGDRCICSV